MTYAQAQDDLNIILDDSDDFTFTVEQKQRALTKAWNDPYNVSLVTDSSQTYDQNTYTYTKPTSMDYVKGIYYITSSEPYPVRLDAGLYEVIDSNILFTPEGRYVVPQSATLFIRGVKQLTTSDDLASDREEYVLMVAQYNLLGMLLTKKINKFLKNDTTANELMASKESLRKDITEWRRRFAQAAEVF